MKLFVNARFLTQPVSGVQRYGIECSRQIKRLLPEAVFLVPGNVIHTEVANELNAVQVGRHTGHRWEQVDLPRYLAGNKGVPLLSLANTAPLLYKNNFICIHDLAFHHFPSWNSRAFATWYNILVPRLAARAKHIFTVSNTIKSELREYYHIDDAKVSVTYNGIATPLLKPEGYVKPAKEPVILAVGSFNLRKNHDKLIRAFLSGRARATHQLHIIGDKSKVFAETGISDEDISEGNIIIHEHATDELLRSLYERASVLASLSAYEGFGIPVLEGLYYDCKVLCSDIPVYRELFSNYVSFCNPGDVGGISATLDSLCLNHDTFAPQNVDVLLRQFNYGHAARIILSAIFPGAFSRSV